MDSHNVFWYVSVIMPPYTSIAASYTRVVSSVWHIVFTTWGRFLVSGDVFGFVNIYRLSEFIRH